MSVNSQTCGLWIERGGGGDVILLFGRLAPLLRLGDGVKRFNPRVLLPACLGRAFGSGEIHQGERRLGVVRPVK